MKNQKERHTEKQTLSENLNSTPGVEEGGQVTYKERATCQNGI